MCLACGKTTELAGWLRVVRADRAVCPHTAGSVRTSSHNWNNRIELTIPYVDAAFIADQFNRYRKQQKVYLNRNLTNTTNSFKTPPGGALRPGLTARERGSRAC